MFVNVYDINAILVRCLKTKAGAEHLQTFKDVHNLLLFRGLQPKYCRMDNECSAPIKTFIIENEMELQLTPPEMHRINWAEQSIKTGKAHLIYGLVCINPKFLLHLWCRLIPQCERTLNMMRPTTLTPKFHPILTYRVSMTSIESHCPPPPESLQSYINPKTTVSLTQPMA